MCVHFLFVSLSKLFDFLMNKKMQLLTISSGSEKKVQVINQM